MCLHLAQQAGSLVALALLRGAKLVEERAPAVIDSRLAAALAVGLRRPFDDDVIVVVLACGWASCLAGDPARPGQLSVMGAPLQPCPRLRLLR